MLREGRGEGRISHGPSGYGRRLVQPGRPTPAFFGGCRPGGVAVLDERFKVFTGCVRMLTRLQRQLLNAECAVNFAQP